MVNENDDGARTFNVFRLSPEQLCEEIKWHKLFQKHVGFHTNYDENGKREGKVHPESGWHEFYEQYKNYVPLDLSKCEVLAQFES